MPGLREVPLLAASFRFLPSASSSVMRSCSSSDSSPLVSSSGPPGTSRCPSPTPREACATPPALLMSAASSSWAGFEITADLWSVFFLRPLTLFLVTSPQATRRSRRSRQCCNPSRTAQLRRQPGTGPSQVAVGLTSCCRAFIHCRVTAGVSALKRGLVCVPVCALMPQGALPRAQKGTLSARHVHGDAVQRALPPSVCSSRAPFPSSLAVLWAPLPQHPVTPCPGCGGAGSP